MTHNPLRFGAQLNAMHLAKVTKTANFFKVSRKEFQKISKIKGISANACFNELRNGSFQYSEERTKIYNDWLKDTSRPAGLFSHEGIFHVKKEVVSYAGEAYAMCGEGNLQLYSVFFFARNK